MPVHVFGRKIYHSAIEKFSWMFEYYNMYKTICICEYIALPIDVYSIHLHQYSVGANMALNLTPPPPPPPADIPEPPAHNSRLRNTDLLLCTEKQDESHNTSPGCTAQSTYFY
jgi:hypothetical protein